MLGVQLLLAASLASAAAADVLETIQVESSSDLNAVTGVAISPDDLHVYAVAYSGELNGTPGSLFVFARDAFTGQLTHVQTLADDQGGIDGLLGVRDVAVSPDGSHVYTCSLFDDAIDVFVRDAGSGQLTLTQVEIGNSPLMAGVHYGPALAISADGQNLYAVVEPDGLAVLSRDAMTGAVSVLEVHRNGAAGVDGLQFANDVIVSPDGAHVYARGSDLSHFFTQDSHLAIFSRDPMTGALTFASAVHESTYSCLGPGSIAFSPDGLNAYVDNRVFSRNPTTGALTLLETHAAGADGLHYRNTSLAVSPDGEHVYGLGDPLILVNPALVDFSRNDDGTIENTQEEYLAPTARALRLAVSGDSRFVYAGSLDFGNGRVTVFQRRSLCAATPAGVCRNPGSARLAVRNDSVDKRDRVTFKWLAGDDTSPASLGIPDPVPSFASPALSYAACVYDANGLVAAPHAPKGEFCVKTHYCWAFTGSASAPTGVRYNDAYYRTPDGMQRLKARSGTGGTARITHQAAGQRLRSLPAAALTPPVTAQVINSLGECWGATFSGSEVTTNTSTPTVPLNFFGKR